MKKNRKNELDVDVIGGDRPLTQDEDAMIRNYIASQDVKEKKLRSVQKKNTTSRKSASAAN